MSKATFVVPFIAGKGPDVDINLLFDGNVPGYGYSCIGQVGAQGTCLVLVISSIEVLDVLAADPKYIFVEEIDG